MKNKAKDGINKIIIWILNIVIIILSLFLVINAGAMISEMHNAYDWSRSTEYMDFRIEKEEYHELMPIYYYNIMSGYESNEEELEYYGVARYYDVAVIYKAYLVIGNEEMASKYKEKMQEAEKMMGGWIIAKEGIHKQLGID